MNISVAEKVIRVVTLTPEGRLDAFSSPELRVVLEKYLTEGVFYLVIDLSNVSFLDSAGMALLVNALKRTRQVGGDVKLVEPKEEAASRILRLTKFDRVFDIARSSTEAASAFLR